MLQNDHPPIDDPNLACYQNPKYRKRLKLWSFFNDLWNSDLTDFDIAKKYLPKQNGEPPKAYKARLANSAYSDYYRSTIESYAGVFLNIDIPEYKKYPESFQNWMHDVDSLGTTLETFLDKAKQLSCRDGYCFVKCGYDKKIEATNYAEEKKNKAFQQAKWGIIPAISVINWLEKNGELQQATIVEQIESEKSLFDIKLETVYRVITRTSWRLFKVIKKEDNNSKTVWENKLIEEGVYTGQRGNDLTYNPLIFFSEHSLNINEADQSIFAPLANLNRQYWQAQSELTARVQKTCNPTPCVAPGEGSQFVKRLSADTDFDTDLQLGGHHGLNVGAGGGAFYLEPEATALDFAAEQIKSIIIQMIRFAPGLFADNSNVDKTATEIRYTFFNISKKLSRSVMAFTSQIEKMLWIYYEQTGIEVKDFTINADISGVTREHSDLLSAFGSGAISQELFLELGFPELSLEQIQEEIKRKAIKDKKESDDLVDSLSKKDENSGDNPRVLEPSYL